MQIKLERRADRSPNLKDESGGDPDFPPRESEVVEVRMDIGYRRRLQRQTGELDDIEEDEGTLGGTYVQLF